MLVADLRGETLAGVETVADRLTTDGLIMLHHADVPGVRQLLATWTRLARHPDDREPGLTVIEPRAELAQKDGMAGFGRATLLPHTDRSLDSDPPSLLASVMIRPAKRGGEVLLVDGAKVLSELVDVFGFAVVAELRLRSRYQEIFPVIGLQDGLARIRFRSDELADLDEGNDCREIVAAWRRLVSAATRVRFRAGDGYLLHNHRYLHGRLGYAGPRRLARLLATVADGHRLSWLNRGFRCDHG